MVMAPAKTGNDNNNSTAVIKTAQTKRGNLSKTNPGALIFIMVVMKFMAPIIEEAPATCKLNIAKSTEPPE